MDMKCWGILASCVVILVLLECQHNVDGRNFMKSHRVTGRTSKRHFNEDLGAEEDRVVDDAAGGFKRGGGDTEEKEKKKKEKSIVRVEENEGIKEMEEQDERIADMAFKDDETFESDDVREEEYEENIVNAEKDFRNLPKDSEIIHGDVLVENKEKLSRATIMDQITAKQKNLEYFFGSEWPEKTVPYYLSSKFLDDEVKKIDAGIQEIETKSCVNFDKKNQKEVALLKNFLYIYKGEGCYSHVGMMDDRFNEVSLGRGCHDKATVVHELLHTLGFFHEQSRPDRKKYINVLTDNIKADAKNQFLPEKFALVHDTEYDYKSVMHYTRYEFGEKEAGVTKPTLIPKSDDVPPVLGQPYTGGLSSQDTYRLNRLYKCSGTPDEPPKRELIVPTESLSKRDLGDYVQWLATKHKDKEISDVIKEMLKWLEPTYVKHELLFMVTKSTAEDKPNDFMLARNFIQLPASDENNNRHVIVGFTLKENHDLEKEKTAMKLITENIEVSKCTIERIYNSAVKVAVEKGAAESLAFFSVAVSKGEGFRTNPSKLYHRSVISCGTREDGKWQKIEAFVIRVLFKNSADMKLAK